jgi:hypothetical protein
MAKPRGRREM